MGGDETTPFQESKPSKSRGRARIGTSTLTRQSILYIPAGVKRRYLSTDRVKILFDPDTFLIALKPSKDRSDYRCSTPYVSVTSLVKTYRIPSQDFDLSWDRKNNWLVGRLVR